MEHNNTQQYKQINVVAVKTKSPEERKKIREKILQERRAAFNALAKY